MAGLNASGGGGFDYVQAAEPAAPENGELWFDTDGGPDGTGEVKVYDGDPGQWEVTGYVSHDQLTNVSPGDHHDPVTVTAPLTRSQQALALAIANGLTVDANDDLAVSVGNALHIDGSGRVAVASNSIGTGELAFDTATQSELDSHAGDTMNPHNVTDDQTGAASALSTHAGDSNAHHSPPTSTQKSSSASSLYEEVSVSGNGSELIGMPVSVVGASSGNPGSYVTYHFADGSTWMPTDNSATNAKEGYLVKAVNESGSGKYAGFEVAETIPHSHSI